ncbi:MAG: hypothetical protein QOI24_2279 [Acidobacteriota bacterium]|jgi:hypothetical protein|nr:hypothetical protein [Acidobacteriota bacterium]
MSHRAAFVLLLLLSPVIASARGNLKELTVPLKFATQEGVHTESPDIQPSVLHTAVVIRVEDARKLDDPLLIGEGTGGDDRKFPIHADHPIAPFVEEAIVATAKDWGVSLATSATRTLMIQITRFNLDEANKALGSIYTAEVKLAFILKDAGGRTLAEGSGSGSAHRYGHAHSPDNCSEVLSDALKEAFSNVMADTGLQQAWTSGRRTGGTSANAATSAPAAAKETPEERLRALDGLLKKGLITKEEYTAKRAEILKEM